MGLFPKKKSDSQQEFSPVQNTGLSTDMLAPPIPPKGVTPANNIFPDFHSEPRFDFTKDPTQFNTKDSQKPIPPPPMSLSTPNEPKNIAPPSPEKKTVESAQEEPIRTQQKIIAEEVDEFELPDFDETDLRNLQFHDEPLPDIILPEGNAWTNDPLAPPIAEAPEETDTEPEPVEETISLSDKLKQGTIADKYIDISEFLKLKEILVDVKNMARSTEEQLMADSYKPRVEKYALFSASLNAIQDRLMLIDGKLFETSEVNE